MSESLLSRVRRIVSGSLNQMVAAAENAAPETVMSEAIREIESAVNEVRDELGKVRAQKHNANRRLVAENNRHEELSEKIKLALDEDRVDLAEAAAATQLDIEAQIPFLESTISDCDEREKELENYILALRARMREMESELDQMKAAAAESAKVSGASVDPDVATGEVDRAVERASAAFDRVLKDATGSPAATSDADPQKMAELEEMARKNRIQERLAQFRQK